MPMLSPVLSDTYHGPAAWPTRQTFPSGSPSPYVENRAGRPPSCWTTEAPLKPWRTLFPSDKMYPVSGAGMAPERITATRISPVGRGIRVRQATAATAPRLQEQEMPRRFHRIHRLPRPPGVPQSQSTLHRSGNAPIHGTRNPGTKQNTHR